MSLLSGARALNTDGALEFARQHVNRDVVYSFTKKERRVLDLFCSNTDKHVFLIENLPSNVCASLLAMYSRLKNKRGLRGVLVDVLIPNFLAGELDIVQAQYAGETERFLKEHDITSLQEFVSFSDETKDAFSVFLDSVTGVPEYIIKFSNGRRVKRFLEKYLDAYGHNSIARLGYAVICYEQISQLAAKTIEHPRAGAGFIELSTRYVDMKTADYYDIVGELKASGVNDADEVTEALNDCAEIYVRQMEEYTSYLQGVYPDAAEGAIFGEVCDVLANVLPAATHTSVGVCISGEGIKSLIKCLLLERLPETTALAEFTLRELEDRSGLGQFARHVVPTAYEWRTMDYLDADTFHERGASQAGAFFTTSRKEIEHALANGLEVYGKSFKVGSGAFIRAITEGRGAYDKLPPLFENALVRHSYLTTMRTWREIQRHVLCSHGRTLLTPLLGFFKHNKPISDSLLKDFRRAASASEANWFWLDSEQVTRETLQYILPMGFNVGCTIVSNLRQAEFFTWQRSGSNVNNEARQVALGLDTAITAAIPWWPDVSRTDRTPAYRLARETVGVPI